MRIAILDDYQQVVSGLKCFALLNQHQVTVFDTPAPTETELVNRLKSFDALVLIRERTAITRDLLSQLPNLKVICQTGKISHHLDMEACQQYGITVLESASSPVAPAELTWTLIMAASRQIVPYANELKAGHWQQNQQNGLGRNLCGLVLGIWGYGRIGRKIARFADAFGMHVLIWGSQESRQTAILDGLSTVDTREDLFELSDILSLHLRLSDSTKHVVQLQDLLRMKSDALLVNTSRADLIAPGALYQALQLGRPGYAALDVFSTEPATPDQEPLISLSNVLATPHLGYVEHTSYELYFRTAFENLLNFWAHASH